MKWKFEEEFRLDKPETIGKTDIYNMLATGTD